MTAKANGMASVERLSVAAWILAAAHVHTMHIVEDFDMAHSSL